MNPIEALHGIGSAYGAELRAAGFGWVDDLVVVSPTAVMAAVDAVEGLTAADAVQSFIPQAELCRVPGVEPVSAHALAASGIRTVDQLAFAGADLLTAAGLASEAVGSIQLEAARRAGRGVLRVRVVGPDGSPVEGASVVVADPPRVGTAARWHHTSDSRGMALVECLAAGRHQVHVRIDELGASLALVVPSQARMNRLVRLRPVDEVDVDEHVTGVSLSYDPTVPVVNRRIAGLDEVAGLDVCQLTRIVDGVAEVASARLMQEDGKRVIVHTDVPEAQLPQGVAPGDLLTWTGSELIVGPEQPLHMWRLEQLLAGAQEVQ